MVRRRGTLTPSKGTHRRGFLSVPAPLTRVDNATSPRGTASLQQPQTPYTIALGAAGCWCQCCSVCRSKMRHLVCVCLHEGRASCGARDINTAGWICCQPVEPVDKAQHIRHEYV